MISPQEPVLVVAAVIKKPLSQQGEILIVRRGPGQSGAGFWEFPGGKVEPFEASEQALVREIQEELNYDIRVGALVGEKVFAYPAKTIRLRVYWADILRGEMRLTEHDAFAWVRPQDIKVEELSEADRPFVALLS